MALVTLVVPCFNEANRLDASELARLLAARADLSLVFVDDGSTDGTAEVLDRLHLAAPARVEVRRLERNRGKGEAVRDGLRAALARGATLVGYCDADLSTPVDELLRLVAVAEESRAEVILGARVQLLGTRIERRAHRHYLGRVFATLASLALRMPVYDTQCGAKLLRATPTLAAALARPFRSRWAFDVELIQRLRDGGPGARPLRSTAFLEVPLQVWRDVGVSKLRPRAMLVAGAQVLAMLVRSRLRRRPHVPADEPAAPVVPEPPRPEAPRRP
jgi:glycosyltransferase involved in cell wall biosynthesis